MSSANHVSRCIRGVLLATAACVALPACSVSFESATAVDSDGWRALFDGRSLAGWRLADEFDFSSHGAVEVERAANPRESVIVLGAGDPMTGIVATGDFPRDDYEVELEAKRIDGGDFFCGMTFPVGQSFCTLIVGGWGGSLVGLSNIDDFSAAENDTTTARDFEENAWYAIRLRVSREKIEVWIDGESVIDLDRDRRRFSIWMEQEPMRPFGIATYYTKAGLRRVRVRSS